MTKAPRFTDGLLKSLTHATESSSFLEQRYEATTVGIPLVKGEEDQHIYARWIANGRIPYREW